MDVTQKVSLALVSFLAGIFIMSAFTAAALTLNEKTLIESEQEFYQERTGTYFDDNTDSTLQIFTYESPCKGYFVKEKVEDGYEYTGFGYLADDYTYNEYYEVITPTTTDIIEL